MENTELWFLAQTWVRNNKVLIRCIAAPYYKFMPCDAHDMEHEALLSAFQVMNGLICKNKDLSLMSKYYRVVFRSRCIKLAHGVPIKPNFNLDQIVIEAKDPAHPELDETKIQEALQGLTNRQRQISNWILTQDKPVTISMVAQKYEVQRRTIQAVISNAINRLNGNQRICSAV